MAKYYYKTAEDSATGKQIAIFWNECMKVEKKADAYARRMGAEEFFFSPEGFTGGVEWLVFAHPERVNKERWKEGEPIDGTRVWKPNVTTVLHRGNHGKVYSTFESPHKKAKTKLINGKRTLMARRDRYHNKYSQAFLSAVRAEKERLALPVMSMEDLCGILQLERVCKVDDKKEISLINAPTFFLYHGEYYISCDDPSSAQDMELINYEKYRFCQNMALNEMNGLNAKAEDMM